MPTENAPERLPGELELPIAATDTAAHAGARAWVFSEVDRGLMDALRAARYRRVALQVPAGLVAGARDLAERFRAEAKVDVRLLTRSCFGACDFPSPDEAPGVDALVVLGHAPIPNVRLLLPTYFVEMRSRGGDPERLMELVASAKLPTRLGLVASVQHLDLIAPLRVAAQRRGYTLVTGEGDQRLAYAGQALGCNYTPAEAIASEVDAYLFLGTGRFHAIGLAFAVDRPVWTLDPLRNHLEPPIDRRDLVRRRLLLVAACRTARRWGVLVSTFAGQNRGPMALSLVRKARERGLDAETLIFGRLHPDDLIGRDFDAYVSTACPRIALDDSELYPRPILTPPEFLMALGERPLDEYRFDTYH